MQGGYEQLTGWHDFHARQYDAALGRWFGVDPQNQFASPYLAMEDSPLVSACPEHRVARMQGRPILMIDPDGEFFGSHNRVG